MSSDTPPGDDNGPARARVLAVVAAALFVGAGAFAVAGVGARGDDGPVLVVDDAVTADPPETVPPVVTDPPSPAVTTVEVDDADAAAKTDAPVPPAPRDVVELAHPPDDPDPARPRPVGLRVSTIDVARYPIRAVGLEDNGQLEIPDETEIGWYKYGATAGHPGATVLAAHVNWNGVLGPFADLGAVEPGDRIEVALHDGTERTYEVTERAMYGKLELPKARIWRNSGAEELVLITCGGEFNPELRSYKSNIVVYAVPVA